MAKVAKPRSVFNLIDDLFGKKIPWNQLPESDQKLYDKYIINMAISQKMYFIDLVNYLQRFNLDLDSRLGYIIYTELLPKGRQPWSKFIKAQADDAKEFSNDLIEFIAKHQMMSTKEVKDNLKLLKNISNDYIEILIDYLKKFGIDDKEISKKYKLKIK